MKTDCEFIKSNDFEGIIAKYDKYITHYARALQYLHFNEVDDNKQDLLLETWSVWKWIDKKKINNNFNFKYFLFQKFNAYRKSKKIRTLQEEHKTITSLEATLLNENVSPRCITDYRVSIENTYMLEKEFPETLSKKEKDIYWRAIVHSDKIKNICEDLKINYNEFCALKNEVQRKFNNYTL